MHQQPSAWGRWMASVALLLGAFGLGWFMRPMVAPASTVQGSVLGDINRLLGDVVVPDRFTDRSIDFDLYWKVRKALDARYLRGPIDEKKLFYGSLMGMVASLQDPYSVFFDPEQAKEFADQLSGTFSGIGAEVGIKDDVLTIIAPLPDSPAERAGLMARDMVVAIDGTETMGMSTDEAVRLIRGEEGTQVKLMIFRKGWNEAREFTITRGVIVFKSVRMKWLPGGIAHVELSQFNEETPELFDAAVKEIVLKKAKGLVLDLRNNPGGLLNVAVAVAGEWLPNEVIVQEKNNEGVTDTLVAYGAGRLKDIPTIVLVNGGSASASEILSGALQDYGKARLVGETTFGKGVVQEVLDFDGGVQLKLTVAEWLTGKGRSIDKAGIKPDFEVQNTSEDFNRDRDPQLNKALELLK